MNKLTIDRNKVLRYDGASTLYAGEIDFEQLRVCVPKTIGRVKMRDYKLSGASLVIITSENEYTTALTFELSDDHTGFISQIIPVDEDWCQYTGVIYAYVQFSLNDSLGMTNSVAINVVSNVNDDIPAPADEFARKSYVDEAIASIPTVPGGVIYAGRITAYTSGVFTVQLTDEMKTKLDTTEDTATLDLSDTQRDDTWDGTLLTLTEDITYGGGIIRGTDMIFCYALSEYTKVYRIIRSDNYGGKFTHYVMTVETAEAPPTDAVSDFYTEGTHWFDTANHAEYVCVIRTGDRTTGLYTYTWARITDVPQGLIFAGRMSYDSTEEAVSVTLSDKMKERLGTEDESALIDLSALSEDWDDTYAYVSAGFDFEGRHYFTGDYVLLNSDSSNMVTFKGVADSSYVPHYAPVVSSTDAPPATSDISYADGTMWYHRHDSTFDVYVTAGKSYNGGGTWAYTWKKLITE